MKKNKTFKLNEQDTGLLERYAELLGCSQADVISRAIQVMDAAVREHRKVYHGVYSSESDKQKVISFDFLATTLQLLRVTDTK